MFTVGVVVYRVWLERGGKAFAVVVGHSFGEYVVFVVVGVIVFSDVVLFVQLCAEVM